jgi:two-component system, response regulator PdtaR
MAIKILIVEDDRMLCTLFEMFALNLNFEIVGITQKGSDAIEICNSGKPDIVLMDIHLAGEIDGIEASKIIGEKFDLPIVYISSDVNKDTFQSCIMENTYGFIVKPIYQSILHVTIEFALAKFLYDKDKRKLKIK